MPVPTAASVIARSGAASKIHNTDMITLQEAKMITEVSSRFVAQTDTAATTRNVSRMTLIGVMTYHFAFLPDLWIGGNLKMGDQVS